MFYEALGIDASAGPREVRAAFKRRALVLHPDKGGSKEAFQLALEAFETLSDPSGRARYDRALAGEALSPHRRGGQEGRHRRKRQRPDDGTGNRPAGSRDEAQAPQAPQAPEATPAPQAREQQGNDQQAAGSAGGGGQSRTARPFRRVLDRVHALLARLPAETRRQVLSGDFTEKQRRSLEAHLTERRAPRTAAGGAAAAAQGPASGTAIVACPTSSGSDSCSPESEDGSLSEGVAPMLCDAPLAAALDFADSDADSDGSANSDGEAASAADAGRDHARRAGLGAGTQRSRTGIRGLSRKQKGNCIWYEAMVFVERMRIMTPFVRDLNLAVDHLIVLTAMKSRFFGLRSGCFEARIRQAIAETFQEHGTSMEELGLRFSLTANLKWLLGQDLRFPTVRDLDTALRVWQYLRHLWPRVRDSSDFAERVEKIFKLEVEWPEFRRLWLDIVARTGQDVDAAARRLDATRSRTFARREQCLEAWSSQAMAAADREQRRFVARERHLERRGRHAMAREDRECLDRLLRALRGVLARWQRLEDGRAGAAVRRSARAKAAIAKQDARSRATAAKQEAQEARRRAAEREAWWRWMNRKDITMAELLGGQK